MLSVTAHSTSAADDLGFHGQLALSRMMSSGQRGDYRLIGGHMVRLLLLAYPTERAVPRSTVDVDAGLSALEVAGPLAADLLEDGFRQTAGSSFMKELATGETISLDLLVPSRRPQPDLRPVTDRSGRRVDSLPALSLVMGAEPLLLTVDARLRTGERLRYIVPVPAVDMALVLKSAGWQNRRSPKDVADIVTLLEIREAHPDTPWSLGPGPVAGRRLDAARSLRSLDVVLGQRSGTSSIPAAVDRPRLRALIRKHVAVP